jgi:hypothetical protein
MSFIDRLNIYCKGGSMLGIKFTAEEKKMLARVEAAETFDEVLTLTEEIYAWSKQKMEDEQQDPNGARAKSGDFGDDDSDEFDDFSDDESDEMDSDESSSSSASFDDDDSDDEDTDGDDADGDDEDESGSQKSDDPISGGSLDKSKSEDEDNVPESETEKAWQQNIQTLIQNSEFHYVYAQIPKLIDYSKTVIDYKQVLAEQKASIARSYPNSWIDTVRADLQKFKTDEKATVSFMVKEFEMRKAADEHARTSIAKTGVIDTNKLHSYKYNDDLFRRITTIATGKNHGFVMFVDWSGSMDSNLRNTVRQLLSLVMFCRQVQVPFEVYTFRSVTYTDTIDKQVIQSFTTNTNELNVGSFFARNILSSRMSAQEMNDAMFHVYAMGHGGRLDCDPLGSTPLNQAIMVAPEIVNRFKARSKVQIVNTLFLTDGESDPISSVNGIRYSNKPDKYIIHDDITKKNYEVPAAITSRNWTRYTLANQYLTPILLKILRDRTGCNLIGFYITSNGFEREYRQFNPKSFGEHYTAAKKSWNDNGYFGVTSAGYDEYYILNPGMFKVSSGNLSVGDKATKRSITSAFIKFSEKKTVSRVLLSQVVKRIAA